MDEYMSVEFADEVGVGAEEVGLRYGGDLGLRQHHDDVVAGKRRIIEFRHFFPRKSSPSRQLFAF